MERLFNTDHFLLHKIEFGSLWSGLYFCSYVLPKLLMMSWQKIYFHIVPDEIQPSKQGSVLPKNDSQ